MNVMKIAIVPPPAVQKQCTVKEAIPAMTSLHGCAVAVMDGDRMVGILSRDEVLTRVVSSGLDPEHVTVGEIMDPPAATVSMETETGEAIRWMFANRKCYLGLVDGQGALKGWLAICSLFEDHVADLNRELDSLSAFISADGPGG